MEMKTLIICESVHHGNTKKIADAMAAELNAEVKKPGEVDVGKIGEYDLVGFGSGVYMGKMHKNLLKLADSLPQTGTKSFVFSTAGSNNENLKYHKVLKDKLAAKGFRVTDEFTCRGFDTFGPLVLIGGLNKWKPDEKDLESARQFAARLKGSK
jgi:flavodoxin